MLRFLSGDKKNSAALHGDFSYPRSFAANKDDLIASSFLRNYQRFFIIAQNNNYWSCFEEKFSLKPLNAFT